MAALIIFPFILWVLVNVACMVDLILLRLVLGATC